MTEHDQTEAHTPALRDAIDTMDPWPMLKVTASLSGPAHPADVRALIDYNQGIADYGRGDGLEIAADMAQMLRDLTDPTYEALTEIQQWGFDEFERQYA